MEKSKGWRGRGSFAPLSSPPLWPVLISGHALGHTGYPPLFINMQMPGRNKFQMHGQRLRVNFELTLMGFTFAQKETATAKVFQN